MSAAILPSLPPVGTQEHPETPQSRVWRTEERMKRELRLTFSAAAVITAESYLVDAPERQRILESDL